MAVRITKAKKEQLEKEFLTPDFLKLECDYRFRIKNYLITFYIRTSMLDKLILNQFKVENCETKEEFFTGFVVHFTTETQAKKFQNVSLDPYETAKLAYSALGGSEELFNIAKRENYHGKIY